MSRHSATLALLALAGSAGFARAQQFIPMNAQAKNYNETRTNTANKGIIAFFGQRDTGDPVAGLWDWRTDEVAEMPPIIGDLGEPLPFEPVQLRTTARGPGDPIKGINIGLIKKPPPSAAIWDAGDGAPGTVYELPNGLGMVSWATAASTDTAIVGGALGDAVSRYAAIWTNAGDAELLPVPAGTNASEVWDMSPSGGVGIGFAAIATQGMSSDQGTRPKPVKTNAQKGIIWDFGSGTFQEVDPSTAGAESLVFAALSGDGSSALAWAAHADDSTKAGLYDILSQSFTPLDAGDLNGDGQIDLADLHDSVAYALSEDGSVIGGSYTPPGGQETAAFWSIADGYQMHDLAGHLIAAGVTGLEGWHLTSITGVSDDGTVLSGAGYDPSGFADVWVAVLTVSCPVDLNEDGVLDLSDINLFGGGFLSGDPVADLDSNGILDLADINLFVTGFLGGCP